MSLSTTRSLEAVEAWYDRWMTSEKLQIFGLGMSSGVVMYLLVTKGPQGILQGVIGNVLCLARSLPGMSDVMEQAEGAVLQGLVDEMAPIDPHACKVIPQQGQSPQEVTSFITKALQQDMSHGFNEGRSFAGIYHFPHSILSQVQAEVMKICLDTNLLYPTVFKTCRKMEAEVVAMVISLLKGRLGLKDDVLDQDCAPNACGLLTTGGTESILLAVKAYRDSYYAKYGENAVKPEVIACITCHPALDKACHYFGVVLHKLPAVEATQAFPVDMVEKYVKPQTCMIYASAPSFPHGVVDDVPALAQLALKHNVGLHVDNCLGGVLLSYAYAMQERARDQYPLNKIPMFDFRVPGVTSVSIDVHKYGCAPKGASVVAFRTEELRRQVYSVVTDWPGGLYATPTATGSRSGAMAATAWATMKYIGGQGYYKMTQDVQFMTARVIQVISSIPQLKVVGEPQACIIAFTTTSSSPFHIYSLAARMEKKGYHLNSIQLPTAIAFCVSERFASIIEDWVAALKDCVSDAISNPKDPQYEGKGDAGIYGASVVLPANEIGRILKRYCDLMYLVRDK